MAGGTATGIALSSSSAARYRLARVTTGSPTAELTAVGTLVPVDQASVAFGESGTVATVSATVGEHVTAGQTLATLVPGPLQAAVDRAQSQLASAQATLAAAETSETGAATTSVGQSPSRTSSAGSAQAAVLADQHALDRDEHVAEVDLAAAEQACGAASPSSSTAGASGSTPGPAGGSRPASGSSPTSGSTGAGSAGTACAGALGQLSHDQAAVSSATTTLESDEAALATALSSSTAAGGGGTTARSGSTGSASGAPSAGPSSGAAPASPQQLASDQAAVDVASAQLASSQRALGDATLTTPLTGTVAAVGLAPGQAVSSGSSARATSASSVASVVVVAPGADEVVLAVPVTDLPELAVGQPATVVPDATGAPVRGTVSAVGLVATTSSSGVTTYPVTVTVAAGSGLPLRTGGQASVAIVVGHAADVTVVPTSAVHRVGALRTVDVDDAGTVTAVRVTTGVVGVRWTQVTAGLRRGQQVVVADLAAPLPTAATGPGAFGALAGGGFGGPRGAGAGAARARAGGG